MLDRSLIYSEYDNKVIYKVALNKQKTEIISTEHNPGGLCCTKSGDILVCMGYRGTARVSGNLHFTYDGHVIASILKDRFQPSGVATDSLGHILIADRANNAVHLISQDGDFLSYILTENDGISRPYGISVDRHDNLWLVEQEKACVKVYRYL
ncbi:tripartite motif-containing protein 2-like [Saccostrea cucullata]|uniref:tripartite motif-containing protein 2-like n=1 Tax=Saccostrea cuccullata TaxID=36930 RepID=UPI002ED0C134